MKERSTERDTFVFTRKEVPRVSGELSVSLGVAGRTSTLKDGSTARRKDLPTVSTRDVTLGSVVTNIRD